MVVIVTVTGFGMLGVVLPVGAGFLTFELTGFSKSIGYIYLSTMISYPLSDSF